MAAKVALVLPWFCKILVTSFVVHSGHFLPVDSTQFVQEDPDWSMKHARLPRCSSEIGNLSSETENAIPLEKIVAIRSNKTNDTTTSPVIMMVFPRLSLTFMTGKTFKHHATTAEIKNNPKQYKKIKMGGISMVTR